MLHHARARTRTRPKNNNKTAGASRCARLSRFTEPRSWCDLLAVVVEHGWIFSPVLISHAKKGLESSCWFLSRNVWSLSCKPSVFFSQLYARCCTFVHSFIDRLIGWVIYLLIYLCFGFYVSFYLAYLFVCLFIYFRFVPEKQFCFSRGETTRRMQNMPNNVWIQRRIIERYSRDDPWQCSIYGLVCRCRGLFKT